MRVWREDVMGDVIGALESPRNAFRGLVIAGSFGPRPMHPHAHDRECIDTRSIDVRGSSLESLYHAWPTTYLSTPGTSIRMSHASLPSPSGFEDLHSR